MKTKNDRMIRLNSCFILLALSVLIGLITMRSMAQRRERMTEPTNTSLPQPKLSGLLSLEEALALRRSVRDFKDERLPIELIGQLLWAGQGITEPNEGFRTAPSAGAVYPITLYLITPEGVYRYNAADHSLDKHFDEDVRRKLAEAALDQQWVQQAPCNIIITGSRKKLSQRYGRRAETFLWLEAGHVAQNILLQATTLQLGAVPVGAFAGRDVERACRIPTLLEPLYIISIGYPRVVSEPEQAEAAEEKPAAKALVIIPSQQFRDEELFDTLAVFRDAGIEATIASSKTGEITGMLGGKAEAGVLISLVEIDPYDAFVFIGGSGAKAYFEDPVALKIAQQADEQKKILGAICIAPSILANAGVLRGKNATAFSSERANLRKAGANYSPMNVVKHGNIITASGPQAAIQFANMIAREVLQKSR